MGGDKGTSSRRRERPTQTAPPPPPPPPPPPEPCDIFDDVGRYDPLDAVQREINRGVEALPLLSVSAASTSKGAGYFTSGTSADDVSDAAARGRSEEELEQQRMEAVRTLLRAQVVQEQSRAEGRSGGSSRMVVEAGRVHRDVIGGGGLDDGEKKPKGHSMAEASSYDVFPESGDYEVCVDFFKWREFA